MKFNLLISALAIFAAGCTSPSKMAQTSSEKSSATRGVASAWQNRLTCDEGLRIDVDGMDNYQVVLFGPAAQHFADVGAIVGKERNQSGEYVRAVTADRDIFRAVMHSGALLMSNHLYRGNQNFEVRWEPYANGPGEATNYLFHRCH